MRHGRALRPETIRVTRNPTHTPRVIARTTGNLKWSAENRETPDTDVVVHASREEIWVGGL